ncbi:MAG TPA: hypothetical protein EYP68_08270 [Candidatus Korarchaeota archaeon]|nr:hypothetical protein [Candidatus Korarchaeota archaeon]
MGLLAFRIDFLIPQYISTLLVKRLNGLLAPTIPFGITTSLTGFPGCLSVEPETIRKLIFQTLRSLKVDSINSDNQRARWIRPYKSE